MNGTGSLLPLTTQLDGVMFYTCLGWLSASLSLWTR